ncbi:hypothetical protein BGZ65_004214 [Modicella reniformis]|uniref:Uncharacterized protein n=1 Tax=Modicella reniformis TaxID=1440133 RepID=A0A9P6SMC1_9FUNG|nr:hypothetical protein BGZ65_004214 [Modicella reniformis]
MLLSALAELDRKRPEQGIWDRQPFPTLGQSPPETELDGEDKDDQADLEKLLDNEQEQSAQEILEDQTSLPRSDPMLVNKNTTTPSHVPFTFVSLCSVYVIIEKYTLQQVQEAAFEDHDFTAELNVVKILANLLQPFTPRRWKTNDGAMSSSRRIAPHVSTGDVHALQLGAMQLFEALCSADENHFDVNDIYGNPLTNVYNVTSPKGNKDAVFAAFFDVPKINQICQAHGTRFLNRQAPLGPSPETTMPLETASSTAQTTRQVIKTWSCNFGLFYSWSKTMRSRWITTPEDTISALKIQQSTRITSRQIDDISITRKLMKERERALSHSKNQEVKEALLSVSNKVAALSSATSMNQIDSAVQVRDKATKAVRKFNNTPSLTKLKRTQRHRTDRAWAKMSSNIRDHAIQNAISSAPTLEPPPQD